MTVDLNIDWKMLRKQKLELVRMQTLFLNLELKKQHLAIGSMLGLLDSIQDQAAEQIGEVKVFGRQNES